MKRDKRGRFIKESSDNFKHSKMNKLLVILGHGSLIVAFLSLIGYIIECPNPEFTFYGKMAAGAASFGVYLTFFTLLKEETKGVFKRKKNKYFSDKEV